ncbi:S-adenosyl-L-methionine-dependent methyltransferase [Xylaria nigripes]|nr:S-adenosyl-L-methionine-dependent methyltransferase [Xylaria nigripes]
MTTSAHNSRAPTEPRKPKTPRERQNPIETAIKTWHEALPPHIQQNHDLSSLLASAPKRWTVYGPLVLLPTGSFTSPAWRALLEPEPPATSADETPINDLWSRILSQIPAQKPTHLAVNEGIPLHSSHEEENILRSPSGLRMLHGDFGPATTTTSAEDFARAFWVSTKQNGITQVWAPRWTMFSRGNVAEKTRVLRFDDVGTATVAVDLYAGIGYFALCYAALGCRVLCWELNPWSVEGLRRGAGMNGWEVRVVVPDAEGGVGDDVLRSVLGGRERLVVFLEDNRHAAERMRRLDELSGEGGLCLRDVGHVNCGLLPSCRDAWETAWEIVARTSRGWVHLHENVGVADIEARRVEIEKWFAQRVDGKARVCVEHVELVKTFAPGVWHCVFDLCVRRDADAGITQDNIT